MQTSKAIPFLLFLLSTFFLLSIIACNNSLKNEPIKHFYKNRTTLNENELSVLYYGIGSTLITYKGKAVFTDPCLSTPSLKDVAFGNVVTDTALIELLNPALQNVDLTLIGHAHYDHLMDLPYLATKYLPKESKIIGCKTALNIIASANIPQKYVVTNKIKGNQQETGIWIYNEEENVRTMVFESHHPPQIAGIFKFGMGKVDTPLTAIPLSANKWKEGETYTFIIDFLGEEKQTIEKRIFVQTSSGKFPKGMIPHKLLAEKSIDVAIIPADLDRTFQAMDYLKAEHYIVVHWENFFKSKLLKAQPFSKRMMNEIRNKIDEMDLADKVTVPLPGEFLKY